MAQREAIAEELDFFALPLPPGFAHCQGHVVGPLIIASQAPDQKHVKVTAVALYKDMVVVASLSALQLFRNGHRVRRIYINVDGDIAHMAIDTKSGKAYMILARKVQVCTSLPLLYSSF